MIPSLLLPVAVAVSAKLTARRSEQALPADERAALAALRDAGLAGEWELRIAARALAKVFKLAPIDAAARTRAGRMLELAAGRRSSAVAAAIRGQEAAAARR